MPRRSPSLHAPTPPATRTVVQTREMMHDQHFTRHAMRPLESSRLKSNLSPSPSRRATHLHPMRRAHKQRNEWEGAWDGAVRDMDALRPPTSIATTRTRRKRRPPGITPRLPWQRTQHARAARPAWSPRLRSPRAAPAARGWRSGYPSRAQCWRAGAPCSRNHSQAPAPWRDPPEHGKRREVSTGTKSPKSAQSVSARASSAEPAE